MLVVAGTSWHTCNRPFARGTARRTFPVNARSTRLRVLRGLTATCVGADETNETTEAGTSGQTPPTLEELRSTSCTFSMMPRGLQPNAAVPPGIAAGLLLVRRRRRD
jgi:hypothetical protein